MRQKIIYETSYRHTGYKLTLKKVYEEKDRLVVLLEEQGLNIGEMAFDDMCSVVVSTDVQLRIAKSTLPVSFYINKKGSHSLLEYAKQRFQDEKSTMVLVEKPEKSLPRNLQQILDDAHKINENCRRSLERIRVLINEDNDQETGYYRIDSNYTEQNRLNLDSLQENAICLFDGIIEARGNGTLIEQSRIIDDGMDRDDIESSKLSNIIISTLTCGLFGRSKQFSQQAAELVLEMQTNRFAILIDESEQSTNCGIIN